MIDLTVKVPQSRVAEFYSMVGDWLAGPAASEEGPSGPPSAWSVDDIDQARNLWSRLSQPAATFFSVLIDNPGKRFSGEELAATLGIAHGRYGVAGVLAWPGRHAASLGRELPCMRADGLSGDGASYWMTEPIADLFRRARSAEA